MLIYYSHNGLAKDKLNFDGDFVDLPQSVTHHFNNFEDFPCLLQSPIKITNRKWNYLQDLKEVIQVIPSDSTHIIYDLLQIQTLNRLC